MSSSQRVDKAEKNKLPLAAHTVSIPRTCSKLTCVTFVHPELEAEYARWTKILGPDDPYKSTITVGLQQVLRAHFLIADFFLENDYGIGGVGPKNVDLLHSAIYRQFVGFGGKDKWPGSYQKLATLIFGLVKDHPFHDANKRTALLVMLFQLDRLNRMPTIKQKALEDFVVEIADDRLSKYARFQQLSEEQEDAEVTFIADFLKRNTREVETRHYTITYHELHQRLRTLGYELCHPAGNYIDVMHVEQGRRFLGLGPAFTYRRRVCKIGFPGWKKQVDRRVIKYLREKCRLTETFGVDSAVFYRDADPLEALIDEYAEPLRRLADR